jgi:hypothetical protein
MTFMTFGNRFVAPVAAILIFSCASAPPGSFIRPDLQSQHELSRFSPSSIDLALADFRELASSPFSHYLGVTSPEEARRVSAVGIFDRFYVREDHLEEWNEKSDPQSLLIPSEEKTLLLGLGDDVGPRLRRGVAIRIVSLIVLSREEDRWIADEFGASRTAAALAEALAVVPSDAETRPIQVGIPGADLTFIGYRKVGVLMLVPTEDSEFGEQNVARPARDLFAELARR